MSINLEIEIYDDNVKENLIKSLASRSQLDYKDTQDIVHDIVKNVKLNGDKALFEYTNKFDCENINAENVLVTDKEIEDAFNNVDEKLKNIIKKSIIRIEDFHKKQIQNSWFSPNESGEILGQLVKPMEFVGVYVPGGKANYPSSVLMNIVPAKVAGVENIIMVSPPNKNGKIDDLTILSAVLAGATKIYKIGGAQAVSALAFGTKTIPKVDKIVGPGNIFVALAKREVFGYVSIDSIAGPSEILVIADESANYKYVTADLLSQAEHDELASAILITTSLDLAKKVKEELLVQTNKLERKEIIEKSLNDFGKIIVTNNIEDAIFLSNLVAPEHLEICVDNPFALLPKIKNAGAIFLGHYTPEPLGDYMAGPNHVLPTGTTARFFSPLSVDDFIKKSSILSFTKESMEEIASDVIDFANSEGLTAHANSVKVRLEELNE